MLLFENIDRLLANLKNQLSFVKLILSNNKHVSTTENVSTSVNGDNEGTNNLIKVN